MITRIEEGFRALLKSTEDTVLNPVLTPLDSWLVRFSHLHRQSLLTLSCCAAVLISLKRVSDNKYRKTVFPRSFNPVPRIQAAIAHICRPSNLHIAGIGCDHSLKSSPQNHLGTSTHYLSRDGPHRVRPVWRTTLRVLPFTGFRPFVQFGVLRYISVDQDKTHVWSDSTISFAHSSAFG